MRLSQNDLLWMNLLSLRKLGIVRIMRNRVFHLMARRNRVFHLLAACACTEILASILASSSNRTGTLHDVGTLQRCMM